MDGSCRSRFEPVAEMPRVSVLMSVFNGARYLRESVESIVSQTYADFEFIIVDDGSTDDSAQVLRSYQDPRIQVIFQNNCGLAAALNRGLAQARGEFVARQDQDDVSLPDRLASQVRYLDRKRDVALVGTGAQLVSADGSLRQISRQLTDSVLLRWALLFCNPFIHSSVMIRRQALEEVGKYTTDPQRQPPEDYELWSRIALRWNVVNLPEPFLRYREVPGSMSRDELHPFYRTALTISLENMRRIVGEDARWDDARLLQILQFVTGTQSSVGVPKTLSVLRDLLALERAFCAYYSLSWPAQLSLRLHNRRRLLQRMFAMVTC